MPTGGWQCYDHVLRHMSQKVKVKNSPSEHLLDIGVGGGRWGFIFRDCMEWRADRYFKGDWKHQVTGIEVFAEYKTPVWDYAYDRVYIGDMVDLIPESIQRHGPFQYVTFMDVIEHVEKDVGEALLSTLVANCTGYLYIAFPDCSNPERALKQGAVHDNVHETHRALWSVSNDLAPHYEVIQSHADSFAVLKGQG